MPNDPGDDPLDGPGTLEAALRMRTEKSPTDILLDLADAWAERSKIGERAAYIKAMDAAGSAFLYLMQRAGPKKGVPFEEYILWFLGLKRDLIDLDSGIVAPVLDCKNRVKGLTSSEWLERFEAVWAVEVLHSTGMKYKAAAKRVKEAMRAPKNISEAAILSWCAEFRKGRVKHPLIAAEYKNTSFLWREPGKHDLSSLVEDLFKGWELSKDWELPPPKPSKKRD
jgi:hypothetical protein